MYFVHSPFRTYFRRGHNQAKSWTPTVQGRSGTRDCCRRPRSRNDLCYGRSRNRTCPFWPFDSVCRDLEAHSWSLEDAGWFGHSDPRGGRNWINFWCGTPTINSPRSFFPLLESRLFNHPWPTNSKATLWHITSFIISQLKCESMSLGHIWLSFQSSESVLPLISTIPTTTNLYFDNPFLVNYVVYHHYRSLGWVIKGGLKFCVDYLLYKRGPVFSHAEYANFLAIIWNVSVTAWLDLPWLWYPFTRISKIKKPHLSTYQTLRLFHGPGSAPSTERIPKCKRYFPSDHLTH